MEVDQLIKADPLTVIIRVNAALNLNLLLFLDAHCSEGMHTT